MGTLSVAKGSGAIAIGANGPTGNQTGAQALADWSVALGVRATASSTNDIAIGTDATATGNARGSAVSIGKGNNAKGAGAVAIGDPSTANGDGAFRGRPEQQRDCRRNVLRWRGEWCGGDR